MLCQVHVVPAAVRVVRAIPLGQACFLAVEEQQLDGQRVLARLEHARELEEERGARCAIARADEPELPKQLRIVVPGKNDAILAGAGNGGHEIHHPDLVDRGLVVPGLVHGREAEGAELVFDVLARLLDGR